MLEVKNLYCKFGEHEVLKSISFSIPDGEIFTIIGGSGAGKTTIIRALCGLENANSSGGIRVNNHIAQPNEYGLVQQGCCLFQHMNVLENVAYAPRVVKKLSRQQANTAAVAMLEKFGLSDKINCYPRNLSGGQKQRVAIARTLIMNPKILLFDEPTSALDPEMTSDVIKIIQKIALDGISILIVTHDLIMARRVSHRILFLENGSIIENSATEEFFSNPKTERAKSFLRNAACL